MCVFKAIEAIEAIEFLYRILIASIASTALISSAPYEHHVDLELIGWDRHRIVL